MKREVIKLRDAGLILVDEHKDARGMNSAATYSLVGLVAGGVAQSPRGARESTARGQGRRALQFMEKNSMDKSTPPGTQNGYDFERLVWTPGVDDEPADAAE